ncbi:hypothetical protein L596_004427 [Steinernema carpocapsae]|uniref:Uncharacterized protein n=1 Tax=Steinernema carpocapsae TaxID=34508 RepID=A0A4U8UVS4_STECR|nr:hypothetical protein L596_004427 [Steinernema carpocapsae]
MLPARAQSFRVKRRSTDYSNQPSNHGGRQAEKAHRRQLPGVEKSPAKRSLVFQLDSNDGRTYRRLRWLSMRVATRQTHQGREMGKAAKNDVSRLSSFNSRLGGRFSAALPLSTWAAISPTASSAPSSVLPSFRLPSASSRFARRRTAKVRRRVFRPSKRANQSPRVGLVRPFFATRLDPNRAFCVWAPSTLPIIYTTSSAQPSPSRSTHTATFRDRFRVSFLVMLFILLVAD